jgi:hypothetical protein
MMLPTTKKGSASQGILCVKFASAFWLNLVLSLVPDAQEPATGTEDQRTQKRLFLARCFHGWGVDEQVPAVEATQISEYRVTLYRASLAIEGLEKAI